MCMWQVLEHIANCLMSRCRYLFSLVNCSCRWTGPFWLIYCWWVWVGHWRMKIWNVTPNTKQIRSVLLQYVVVPTRRSSAEALQITVGHLLGDAGSPYLLGVVRNSLASPKWTVSSTVTEHFYLVPLSTNVVFTTRSRMLYAALNMKPRTGASTVWSTASWSAHLSGSWEDCFSSLLPATLLKTGKQLSSWLKVLGMDNHCPDSHLNRKTARKKWRCNMVTAQSDQLWEVLHFFFAVVCRSFIQTTHKPGTNNSRLFSSLTITSGFSSCNELWPNCPHMPQWCTDYLVFWQLVTS